MAPSPQHPNPHQANTLGNNADFAARLIRLSPWFAALADTEQQQLLALAQYRQLPAGQRLFSRGDSFDGIYVLLQGGVLIAGVDKTGKEALLTIVEGGDFIGEIALFDKQSRTHDATASCPVQLLWWPATQLQQLLNEQPLWWQRFGQLLTAKMRMVFQAFEDMSLQSAQVRLARRLLLCCRLQQSSAGPCVIPMSQEQLGQLLALSRQTTNQLLQQLEAAGYIEKSYGQITVLDVAGLQQVAELPPN